MTQSVYDMRNEDGTGSKYFKCAFNSRWSIHGKEENHYDSWSVYHLHYMELGSVGDTLPYG